MKDTEPTIRDNPIPERPENVTELAVYELARIMASAAWAPRSEVGAIELLRAGFTEQTNLFGCDIVTDVGQAVWRDLVARMEEELS